MLNKELIIQKMRSIDIYVLELEPYLQSKSIQEIQKDKVLLAFVERRFQLIVDTMLDINTHIISANDFTVPDDYQNTFEVLGQRDVLPMEFAVKIAPVVGLRNRVVHKYEKLDLKQFLNELSREIGDFRAYIKHLDAYLERIK